MNEPIAVVALSKEGRPRYQLTVGGIVVAREGTPCPDEAIARHYNGYWNLGTLQVAADRINGSIPAVVASVPPVCGECGRAVEC